MRGTKWLAMEDADLINLVDNPAYRKPSQSLRKNLTKRDFAAIAEYLDAKYHAEKLAHEISTRTASSVSARVDDLRFEISGYRPRAG